MPIDNDNKDQDIKGRNWDQLTTGTTSVATLGAGSSGDVAGSGSKESAPQPDSKNAGTDALAANGQAGRTDDLLAGGSSEEQGDEGFQGKTDADAKQGSQSAAGTGGGNK